MGHVESIGMTAWKFFSRGERVACFLKLLSWRLKSSKRKSAMKWVSTQILILQVGEAILSPLLNFGSKYVIMAFLFKLPSIFYHTRSCLFRGFNIQAPQEAGGGTVSGSSFHFSHHVHTGKCELVHKYRIKSVNFLFYPEKCIISRFWLNYLTDFVTFSYSNNKYARIAFIHWPLNRVVSDAL